MDSKIFLAKYRVAAEEIQEVGKVTDRPLAYEGEEIDSGKKVIVEVVPAARLKSTMREKLETEAEAAKELRHVNVPALYDFGIQDDNLVYVTEDFEGTLAEEWVNLNGPMPVGAVLRIAAQVVSALGAAAFHRLAHRALSPSNIVLVPGQTAEGEWPLIKVLHFVGGTPAFEKSSHYASPEQVQHGTVDFRSEIYSLGGTMWFLLTGAPPPMVGSIEDKVGTMPKRVGRLLAQMLSTSPAERPNDPLAFYRQLQDCLTQVEQRGTMARAPKSHPVPIEMPKRRRRSPLKTLARAAIVLAMAAITALILREYLRHQRVVQTEEPIGVPIGVPEVSASATPATANAADAIVSDATQPTVDQDSTPSAPATTVDVGNADTRPLTDSASPEPVAVAPVQPTPSDAPESSPIQETPPVMASDASTPTTTIDSTEVGATTQVEVARAPEKPPSDPGEVASQTEPKMPEVRRGELVEEPEVRRAEPAPPDEGLVHVEPVRTPSPSQQTNSGAKTEPTAKPKRPGDEKIYLLPERELEAAPIGRLPRGSVRGRFVGETADGRWMFELPSREIVIVSPPSSSR